MNGASLLPLFLLAVAGGFIAARPDADPDRPLWRGGIGALPAIMLVGVPERRWPPIAPAEDDAGEDDA